MVFFVVAVFVVFVVVVFAVVVFGVVTVIIIIIILLDKKSPLSENQIIVTANGQNYTSTYLVDVV